MIDTARVIVGQLVVLYVHRILDTIMHSGPIWRVRGGIGPKGARALILVSMPKDLGMGNRLRPFSDTSD